MMKELISDVVMSLLIAAMIVFVWTVIVVSW